MISIFRQNFFWCDLRNGSVVLTWLQMTFIAICIACVSPIHVLLNGAVGYMLNYKVIGYLVGFNIIITGLVIKAITCISLLCGIVKRKHKFYEPWLFHTALEILETIFLGFFCFYDGLTDDPYSFIGIFPFFLMTGLNCYFWSCVYTVYHQDKQVTNIRFEDEIILSTIQLTT